MSVHENRALGSSRNYSRVEILTLTRGLPSSEEDCFV